MFLTIEKEYPMKRYVILTSLLSLTACFGGGGSGGGSGVAPVSGPRAAELLGTGTTNSNSEVTSMASAVVVKDGGGYSNFARSAATPDKTTFSGYTIYKLNNVDFKLIEDTDSAFNFDIDDNGRINSVTTKFDNGVEGSAARDETNTAQFNGAIFQLVKSGDNREIVTIADDGEMTQERLNEVKAAAVAAGKLTSAEAATATWNHLTQKWEFEHSDKSDGLTYSDFGYMKTTNVEKQTNISIDSNGEIVVNGGTSNSPNESRLIFAGGYDIPNIPTNGMEFTGKAIGVIATSVLSNGSTYKDGTHYDHHWHDDHYNTDETAVLTTSNAHLVFNEGNEVLTLPFGSKGTATDVYDDSAIKWYDVTITKTNEGATFAFDDGGREIPTRFRTDDTSANDTTINRHTADMGYYGVETPVEATGAVEFLSTRDLTPDDAGSDDVREFHFQAGYGLKKD